MQSKKNDITSQPMKLHFNMNTVFNTQWVKDRKWEWCWWGWCCISPWWVNEGWGTWVGRGDGSLTRSFMSWLSSSWWWTFFMWVFKWDFCLNSFKHTAHLKTALDSWNYRKKNQLQYDNLLTLLFRYKKYCRQ